MALSKECDTGLTKAKQYLSSAPALALNLPICIAADASAYGIGACISRWFRAPSGFCFLYIDCNRTKSYLNLERSTVTGMCCTEVSPIFLWVIIHLSDKLQAINCYLGP